MDSISRSVIPPLIAFAVLAAGTPAQDLELVREIGAANGSASYTFDRIADIAVDDGGRIFVLDGGDRTVKAYDADGRFLRRIGRSGAGPGEFAFPVRVRVDGDTLTITDARLFRVSRFDRDGVHLETMPLPAPDGLGLSDLRVLRSGLQLGTTIFRASLGSAEDHDPYVRALLFRSGSPRVDTVATFQSQAAIWHVVGGKGSWGVEPTALGQGGAIAVDGDSLVAIADGTTGIVQWYTPGPAGLVAGRRVDLAVRAGPVTERDRDAADAALHARNRGLPPRIEFIMPPVRSAVTGRAFFDDTHGLWVELNGDGSQGRVWARVSPDGAVRCAAAPTQLALRAARGDRLYGVWTGDFDVETVRVYRLRPGSDGTGRCKP